MLCHDAFVTTNALLNDILGNNNRGYGAPFSKNSFASLILVARYGLPPRSGWLRSIICRCFLRRISFVTPRSLHHMYQYHPQHYRSPRDMLTMSRVSALLPSCSSASRSLPYSTPFPTHSCLLDIFVVRLNLHAPMKGLVTLLIQQHCRRRTKKAAAATPTPIATAVAMILRFRLLLMKWSTSRMTRSTRSIDMYEFRRAEE